MSVFHLKYRPQKLADLDLVEVSKLLKNVLSGSDIPQSFLFSGPKGAGKTSAARIVAKIVNCQNVKKGEPCGECENCQEIAKGSCVDVIEMDGASNRGIEDIRLLKDKVYLLPIKLMRKVFIIDEVHMLTKEAFNALLKLIEEPPKHTVFILCTTDENKIPETVLSRLMKISFYKGNRAELTKSIKRVVEGEKIDIEDEAINMIVLKSDGSFRNIQKTLNELVLEYGKELTKIKVETYYKNRFGEYKMDELEADLTNNDPKAILTKIEILANKGIDFKALRENIILYFQNKLLSVYGVDGSEKSLLSAKELEKWLDLLIIAGKQEKDVSIDQLPLELAIVKYFSDKQLKTADNDSGGNWEFKQEKTEQVKDEMVRIESEPVSTNLEINLSVDVVQQSWGKLLQAVKPFNHSVEAFLRAARPKSIRGQTIIFEVYYPFHKDKLEEQKNRLVVEKGLKMVLGMDISFECVLSKSKNTLVISNDTPIEKVSEHLAEDKKTDESEDMYEVAKQIFG